MSNIIFHVDMNAYFASVEQKANPLLRGKPILVVADSRRRSVVMTASYEARPFGVKTGMNLYEAKKLCPHAIVIDGNSGKYLDSTAKILETLESFSNQVEMISCDEAYLDVTASQKYFGMDGEGIAKLLKAKIKAAVGLPCSIGIAPNKSLAKLASEKQKPDGLTVIRPEDVERVLAETPVEAMCGVGESAKSKLHQIRIETCKQLGEADLELLQHHFGFWGYWLKRLGQGKDNSPVKKLTDAEQVKSVGHSTTFPRDTDNPEILKSYLLWLSEKVARRLRKGGYCGSTVSLTIRYNDFATFSRQQSRKELTDDGREIYQTAWRIFEERVLPLDQPVRLLGVSVSSLLPHPWQEYLFAAMARREKLNAVTDQINAKFGSFTLEPASLILAERFGILDAPIPPYQHRM